MTSNLITTKELYNVRVMGGKNATKRIGKVRAFVYHPKERRCIGIMVKRPDLLWMFHRKDLFVSLDGFEFEDGRVALADDAGKRATRRPARRSTCAWTTASSGAECLWSPSRERHLAPLAW